MSEVKTKEFEKKQSESKISGGKFLTFFLGEEEYAIQILKVQEIIGLMDITPVPKMPDYIRGVLNLRGKIVPVMNLRTRFRLQEIEDTDETCIIVIQHGELLMGLLVDQVSEVVDIESAEIEDVPSVGGNIQNEYITGIGKVEDSVKMIIEVDQVVFDVPEEVIEKSLDDKNEERTK